jgi:hypothetical protein
MVNSSIAGQAPRSLEDRASIRDGHGADTTFPGCGRVSTLVGGAREMRLRG